MDKTIWVVIAAAVVIAMAGLTLYIGVDGLQNIMGDANDTATDQECRFQIDQCESGSIDFDEMDSECQDIMDGDECPPD